MSHFGDYYKLLLSWERQDNVELISTWTTDEITLIKSDFVEAFRQSPIKNIPIPITIGSTNQSIGNQVADFFVNTINKSLRRFVIAGCSGKGYPDRVLRDRASSKVYPFELKATSSWDSSDSNRRVLTSSSRKLRSNLSPPINHLLATCCYSELDTYYALKAVRFDFIEPSTEVNIRLEASVSHKILADGRHEKLEI